MRGPFLTASRLVQERLAQLEEGQQAPSEEWLAKYHSEVSIEIGAWKVAAEKEREQKLKLQQELLAAQDEAAARHRDELEAMQLAMRRLREEMEGLKEAHRSAPTRPWFCVRHGETTPSQPGVRTEERSLWRELIFSVVSLAGRSAEVQELLADKARIMEEYAAKADKLEAVMTRMVCFFVVFLFASPLRVPGAVAGPTLFSRVPLTAAVIAQEKSHVVPGRGR